MLAAVGAAVLSIAFSGVAAADTVTGQHGNYQIPDDDTPSLAAAICRYSEGAIGVWNIYKIVGRAPSVWWPDTNASITTQHGPVGWRLSVLHKAPSSSTWKLLKNSSIQHATAYEDQLNPYGSSTKAPFTNIKISITASNFPASEQFMAKVKLYWFRSDGSVRGSVVHNVANYSEMLGSFQVATTTTSCVRRILE